MKCNICNSDFNPGDLSEVFYHEHKGIELTIPAPKVKKVISNARDVYPYCGGEFAGGVHIYLQGGEMPTRPCDDDHIQGWMCAQRDLKDNYKLEF